VYVNPEALNHPEMLLAGGFSRFEQD